MTDKNDWAFDLVQRLVEFGDDCAEKEAAAKLLEDSKHSVLSKIKLQFVGQEKSDAARETLARASDEFNEHLKQMCDAKEAAQKARVRYNAQDMFCRLRQTQHSLKKAQMNAEQQLST
jgi:hypothetical protein